MVQFRSQVPIIRLIRLALVIALVIALLITPGIALRIGPMKLASVGSNRTAERTVGTGVCMGDVLLGQLDGSQWSVQLSSELSLQLVYDSLLQVHRMVDKDTQYPVSLCRSPTSPATGLQSSRAGGLAHCIYTA